MSLKKPTYNILLSRFWSKVLKTDCCWLWRGGTDAEDYGIFHVNRQGYRAHRFAYESIYGSIAQELHCGHICNVRRCVRPDHLYPCTPAQNIHDRDLPNKVVCGCIRNPIISIMQPTAEDRFWPHVKKSKKGCWVWTGPLGNRGYGKFVVNRHSMGAHRFSYELQFGRILPGMIMLHRCDNPRCVNPAHLYPGTIQENAVDSRRRARQISKYGEECPWTKLSDEMVRQIRNLRPTMKLKQLAVLFNISESWVSYVARGLRRNHVIS